MFPNDFVTELCVLRTFGGVDFSLIFICAQSVPEFLWDRLRASIQFHVMPKRAQYARFSGEGVPQWNNTLYIDSGMEFIDINGVCPVYDVPPGETNLRKITAAAAAGSGVDSIDGPHRAGRTAGATVEADNTSRAKLARRRRH
eukprot:COSAG02_NODE_12_length_58022_cov_242.077379_25_plen_143_part_00